MHSTAALIAIAIGSAVSLVAGFLALMLPGRAARERRLAEARMNARLLRMNL